MSSQKKDPKPQRPAQTQRDQPGDEYKMKPRPKVVRSEYRGSGKLEGKVAIITGGDSGIGRAVAVLFAREGADVVIGYLDEHKDARDTVYLVQKEGRECLAIPGDIGKEEVCRKLVADTVKQLGRLDILVNNAAEQHALEKFEDITEDQIDRTFRTNIYSYLFCTKHALKHLKRGSAIINSTSVTAYRGNPMLIDYASTKGAIVAFTRSLARQVIERGIRVNGVAPGPIWTPLIPASFSGKKVAEFGSDTPMERAGEPMEVAPSYVFLASSDSSYISGQVLHPNGGEIVNG
jgi:NAD(P)-dependent dehydrogenase (short-subunit alcohol dehydrogenase family)